MQFSIVNNTSEKLEKIQVKLGIAKLGRWQAQFLFIVIFR